MSRRILVFALAALVAAPVAAADAQEQTPAEAAPPPAAPAQPEDDPDRDINLAQRPQLLESAVTDDRRIVLIRRLAASGS